MTSRYLVFADFGISDATEILVSFSMSVGVLYISHCDDGHDLYLCCPI